MSPQIVPQNERTWRSTRAYGSHLSLQELEWIWRETPRSCGSFVPYGLWESQLVVVAGNLKEKQR